MKENLETLIETMILPSLAGMGRGIHKGGKEKYNLAIVHGLEDIKNSIV
jgi:hypothetical protein